MTRKMNSMGMMIIKTRSSRYYYDASPSFSFSVVAGLVLFLVVLMGNNTIVVAEEEVGLKLGEVAYVMEPFEWFNASDEWTVNIVPQQQQQQQASSVPVNITVDQEEALFGDSALRLDFNHNNPAVTGTLVEVGRIQPKTPHSCYGATHLSIWYKLQLRQPPLPQSNNHHHHHDDGTPPPLLLQARLMLLDDDGDSRRDESSMEVYYTDSPLLTTATTTATTQSSEEWKEIKVPFQDLQPLQQVKNGPSSSSSGSNLKLDLHRLRGWKIQLLRLPTTNTTGSGDVITASLISGSLWLDQLACIGGSDMMSTFFNHPNTTWEQALKDGIWDDEWYQSESSRNSSRVEFLNSNNNNSGTTLRVDYTVVQTEAWGGFASLDAMAVGPAYYNLSRVNSLQLGYQIQKPAQPGSRTHLRVLLGDASNVVVCGNHDCDDATETVEWWYHFIYCLDDPIGTIGQIRMPLVGSADDSSMPFWLTGWAGGIGNRQFNKDQIKGFNIQISMDSQGDIGSQVTGSIDLFNFTAHYYDDDEDNLYLDSQSESTTTTTTTTQDSNTVIQKAVVVHEKDMIFLESSPKFRKREFLSSQCQETCINDSDCLYAFVRGENCYTTGGPLESIDVGMANTVALQEDITTFWIDDPTKRGNFCDLCICNQEDRAIDCRRGNGNLSILPKTFDLSWKPRSLDLRNNPHLVFLGSGALTEIQDSLEELWIPKEMRYISPELEKNMPNLANLYWDEDKEPSNIINADSTTRKAFGDVCCSIGQGIIAGVSFCDMRVKTPGVDSTYFPFTQFIGSTSWATVRPSSKFMAEAAESPEKCAEYCSISNECNYFSYDGRKENAEHICYLLEDNGEGPLEVCCDENHYADLEQTLPGWVSGLPPRTRHTVDMARVLIQPQTIAMETSLDGYGEAYFDLRLGSTPIRGAVWVEPGIASSTPVSVVFDPPRAVLYDANTTVRVHMTISAAGMKRGKEHDSSVAFVIQNHVESCDHSYMEFEDDNMVTRETTVFVDVEIPKIEKGIHPAIIVAISITSIAGLGLVIYIWEERKRKKLDTIWIIQKEELIFPETPVVLGLGSFGRVLKAEYKGSEVAVKRALPQLNIKSMRRSGTEFMPSSCTSSASTDDLATLTAKVGCLSNGMDASGMQTATVDRHSWTKLKKSFMAEMRQLSMLRHPSVVGCYGAVVGREPMLVMELMEHGSLKDVLQNETVRLDHELVLPMLLDIASGIRFLHSSNLVHGDLKAANILVDKRFRAKVADLGTAGKRASEGITGTPFWAAPELIKMVSSNTFASDAYAFGVMLVEVYSRKDPYEEEEKLTTPEILKLVADKSVSKRPPVPSLMPPLVASVMTECLVHNPEERPTFEEVDKRLRRVNVKSLENSESVRSSRNVSLEDIFPKHVAEALRDGREVEATQKDCVTIFFSDIVGFTDISADLEPRKVADMLGRLYTKFDELSHEHSVYKVETIGDAYMAVANLVEDQEADHTQRIAQFAIDTIAAAKSVPIDKDDLEKGCVNIRVGFHAGPIVADVVGTRNPRYCLFGDSVNTASRMESAGEAGRIHCSKAAAALLEQQCPTMPMKSRGSIDVKGKGRMHTYWVNEEGLKPSQKAGSEHERNLNDASSNHDLDFYSTHQLNHAVALIPKGSIGRWSNEPSQDFSLTNHSGNTQNEFAHG